jgi:hypothetical protein
MAWETRGKHKYYYRSVRRDGRTRKVYVGSGAKGEAAARADGLRRQRLAGTRAELAAQEAKIAAAEMAQDELAVWSDTLVKAVLLLAGQHQQHGIWRRRIFIA